MNANLTLLFFKVSSSTGGEQGINVTMLAFVNADGDAIPGVFIYPRKKVNLDKMVGLPEGFLPLAHQSGWRNEDLFFDFSRKFQETSRVFSGRSNSVNHG